VRICFWQRGISACAVCDGALPVFRNKVLVVVGGGDSAIEEASHLAKYASKVILMHRRDELRASKAMQKRVFADPRIEIMWNTVPTEAFGEKMLQGLKILDTKSNAKSEIACSGLFYAIGHVPNTSFLAGQISLDETVILCRFWGRPALILRVFLLVGMCRIESIDRPFLPQEPAAWRHLMRNVS
jgi:thioredoxin reductase (NADPH)